MAQQGDLSKIEDQIQKTPDVDGESSKPRLTSSVKRPKPYERVPSKTPTPSEVKTSSQSTTHSTPSMKPTEMKAVLMPYLRAPITSTTHPGISLFIPSSYQMYVIVHYMDEIMRKNSYFKRQQDAWHPFVSRLYFGVLFCIQVMKAEVTTNIASPSRRRFYLDLIRDYPLDTLPVPGPLVTLFESLNPASPASTHYGIVTPSIPEVVGTPAASTLVANVAQLLIPNVPGLLAFTTKITTAAADAIPDYTVVETFNDTADRNLLGSLFTHNAWTQPQRNFLMTPGMLTRPETDRETDSRFRTTGKSLNLPAPAGTDNVVSLDRYLYLSATNEWFGNVLTIMQQYSTYFKGSVTLGCCENPNNVAPLITTEHVSYPGTSAATNPYATLKNAFPDNPIFIFDARHSSFERQIAPTASAVAQAAKINIELAPFEDMPLWTNIGNLDHTVFGNYWKQRPSACLSKVEATWKTIGSSVTQHYALVKPFSK